MIFALVPHAPPDATKLHIWLGVADANAAPPLAWTLNGAASTPNAIRPLTPVLTGKCAAGNPTVYSGFFEFANLQPDSVYQVQVSAGVEQIVRTVKTLPESVPVGPQDRFNVLLMSCFHFDQDRTGLAGKVLTQLNVRPDLSLFMGDQVYLDLPTLRNFKSSHAWLGNKFQNDYLDNWFGDRSGERPPSAVPQGFPQLLAVAPGVFAPDDHEYWNNYPYESVYMQNTWRSAGQDQWRQAAEQTYAGFQQTGALQFGAHRLVNVDPLSILVLDTRSQRHRTSRKNDGDLIGAAGRAALTAWATNLVASAASPAPKYGMFVTGQSLFRSAVGQVKGKLADFEFADYEKDYWFMVGELERVMAAGLPVLCITGDVHWGRMLFADDPSGKNAPLFEVISSPLSLVATVGQDQARGVWNAIKNVFGGRDPWPRHSDAEEAPPRFGSAGQYVTKLATRADKKHAVMRGNHAAMLRFARAGTGLDVEAVYYPLHADDAVSRTEQWSTKFELRAIR